MSLPSFTNPNVLLLMLVLLPIFAYYGWPRLAYRRRRDTLSLAVRLLLVTLIILGLAGMQIRRQADKLAVVFLLDVSDSMDAIAQKAALDYVRDAVEVMTEDDQAAVIMFGANALVEEPMAELLDLSQPGTAPITLNTDLAEAIQLGLALFPPDTAKRMIILSDGVETVGDADRAARLAAASGVQLEYVPFSSRADAPEILVSNVSVPSVVSQDEPFDLVVTVESETDTQANLRVFTKGEPIFDEPINLQAGTNRQVIGPIQWPQVGFLDFRVQIEPASLDGFYRNNELSAFTRVIGRPSVLVVYSNEGEIEFLEDALVEAGIEVDAVPVNAMPNSLAGFSSYSSIVLANVSAIDLTSDRMELLEIYVRDLGGGLVAIGGPDSYGVGGYFETPLERTLPVEMRIRDQERVPQLTLVFVLDRSGSMEISGTSGFTNLNLAKEAVIRSFNFLNEYDRSGVVSFDHQAFWVVDIQEIGDGANRQALQDVIASLRPGGGTDIYGGLIAADDELQDDPSEIKHMILLTDGGANPEGILPLVDRMYTTLDVTTSVVAVGENYERWLADVPARGGGNFHVTTNVENIPTIFTAETVLATRAYIFEEPFTPTLNARSPIMDGITAVPQLQGYIATTEKDTATVILNGPEEDPILASWQYGLGRAVAFTSDATARWGRDWVTWDDYTRFWNQVVRWTITESRDSNLEAYVEERGEQALLVVDARDNRGDYLNALDMDAAIVFPDRETQSVDMQQVAPGRYEAVFTPSVEGAYFLTVAGVTRPDATVDASVLETAGWVLSYSAEYRPRQTDTLFLSRITSITNGGLLEGEPSAAFAHNLDHERSATPVWPYLYGLAAFLLIADIAVRRIVINRSDIVGARERLGRVLSGGPDYRTSETSTVMQGLKQAKQRASEPSGDGPLQASDLKHAQSKIKTGVEQSSSPTTQADVEPEGTLASRLLKKRRGEDDD